MSAKVFNMADIFLNLNFSKIILLNTLVERLDHNATIEYNQNGCQIAASAETVQSESLERLRIAENNLKVHKSCLCLSNATANRLLTITENFYKTVKSEVNALWKAALNPID